MNYVTAVLAMVKTAHSRFDSSVKQRCYQDQGVRDQDQTGRYQDQDQDQTGRDQDLKKVVLIGLETKTRSRDQHPWCEKYTGYSGHQIERATRLPWPRFALSECFYSSCNCI